MIAFLLAMNIFNSDIYAQNTVNDGYGDYVLVPAGEFQMGDNFNDGSSYERPVHTVYLDVYYIGKYDVTNGKYCQFLNEIGNQSEGGSTWLEIYDSYCLIKESGGIYSPKSGKANHPVIEVNWYGARAYCTWLTNKTGYTYRLPTEAEWEKAARGDAQLNHTLGHQRRYPWGDDIDSSYANYLYSGDPYETGSWPLTTPVGYYDGSTHGSFSTHDNASPYGAYDMAGNVGVWCHDWYGSGYYQECYNQGTVTNPLGPSTGVARVFRGGDWESRAYGLRSAYRRISHYPSHPSSHAGFRCLREAEVSSIHENMPKEVSKEFELFQNYPNPFNPVTTIKFQLPKASNVKMVVYDIQGREVARLVDGYIQAGYHSVTWDARNAASGIYLYRINTDSFSDMKRMLFIK